MTNTCVLCERELNHMGFIVYAEGFFCADSAGCRRNAAVELHGQINDLNDTVADLQQQLMHYEQTFEPQDDPPEPATREGS